MERDTTYIKKSKEHILNTEYCDCYSIAEKRIPRRIVPCTTTQIHEAD